MDFRPPTNLDEMKKEWEKFETPEQFCEATQQYLLATCELLNVALKKGIVINHATGIDQQQQKWIIVAINYTRNWFKPA